VFGWSGGKFPTKDSSFMGFKGSEASQFSTPLLSTGEDGIDSHGNEKNEASSMPLTLVFTAISATIGSYVFGYAVSYQSHILVHNSSESPLLFLHHISHLFLQLGYSSPAQYGIVHDLHLSVAEVTTSQSLFLNSLLKCIALLRIVDLSGN